MLCTSAEACVQWAAISAENSKVGRGVPLQGWTWSEHYQQYGIFGCDESGLYRWYPAPPV